MCFLETWYLLRKNAKYFSFYSQLFTFQVDKQAFNIRFLNQQFHRKDIFYFRIWKHWRYETLFSFYNENISCTLKFELTSRRSSFVLKTKNVKNKASIEIRNRICILRLKPLCFVIESNIFYEFFMKANFFIITRIFVKSTYIHIIQQHTIHPLAGEVAISMISSTLMCFVPWKQNWINNLSFLHSKYLFLFLETILKAHYFTQQSKSVTEAPKIWICSFVIRVFISTIDQESILRMNVSFPVTYFLPDNY